MQYLNFNYNANKLGFLSKNFTLELGKHYYYALKFPENTPYSLTHNKFLEFEVKHNLQ